jgi:cytochrome c oxidase subunit 4
MSEHTESHGHVEHGYELAPGEHPHPSAGVYLRVATILAVLTAIEVAIFYMPAMQTWLVPLLLILSAAKFGLVAAFYMHLKFDSRLFSWLFFFPMGIAAAIIVALMALFGALAYFHGAFKHPGQG